MTTSLMVRIVVLGVARVHRVGEEADESAVAVLRRLRSAVLDLVGATTSGSNWKRPSTCECEKVNELGDSPNTVEDGLASAPNPFAHTLRRYRVLPSLGYVVQRNLQKAILSEPVKMVNDPLTAQAIFVSYFLLILGLFALVLRTQSHKFRTAFTFKDPDVALFTFLTLGSFAHTWFCTSFARRSYARCPDAWKRHVQVYVGMKLSPQGLTPLTRHVLVEFCRLRGTFFRRDRTRLEPRSSSTTHSMVDAHGSI